MAENLIEDTDCKYFRIALAMSGIKVDARTAELIHRICNCVDRKAGEYNVLDAVEIEALVAENFLPTKPEVVQ